jgi:hypothetical protein
MLILPVAPAACPDQLAVYHGCPRTPNGTPAGVSATTMAAGPSAALIPATPARENAR